MTFSRRSLIPAALIASAVVLCSLATLPAATAQRGRLRATVYLTQQQIPNNLNERSLLSFARARNARILQESTDQEIRQRKWIADMVIGFNAQVNDLEYHALFYDIEEGARRFIVDMSIFVNDRTQRTFVQRIRLPRPTFRPNRRTEVVITVARQEVGSLQFSIAGEEIRRSGQVDFTGGDE